MRTLLLSMTLVCLAATSATAEPPAQISLDVDQFKALALKGFEGAIDPALGLAIATTANTPDDQDKRPERRARLLCGAPLDAVRADLKADLARRLEDGKGFKCAGLSCSHPSEMEWDVEGVYAFELGPKGLILRSVTFIEGGGIPEEVMKANYKWANDKLKVLRGLTCKSKNRFINKGVYQVCHTAADKSPGLPLRMEPSWKKGVETIKPGGEMLDGTLVEDLGGRKGAWWYVRPMGPGGVSGWVVSKSTEKGKADRPVLCRFKAKE